MNNRPLEEVANIYSGNSINAKLKKEKYTDKNFSTPYVATKDLSKNGDFEYNNGVTIPDTELDNFKIAPKGSTLICMEGGSAGKKIGLLKQDVCFVNKLGALVPNEKINNRYLYYSLQTPGFQAQFKSSLTGIIGGVSLSKLKKLQIPVPSLQEQEKIVERLDKAFSSISESIQLYNNKLENISKLKQSYIDEIFFNYEDTADEIVLEDVSTIVGRIGYRGYTKKDLVSEGSGALSLSPSNIKNDAMTYIKNTFISWEKYEESPEIKIYNGDIIFCKTGSTYGKVAIVKNLKYKATLNPQLVVLKNLNINNEFLFYQLLTSKFKNFIESIVGGTATPTLSQTNLGKAKILNLNKKIQKDLTIKINTFLKKRNLLENNYIQTINLLEELKTSLLIKEFSYE